MGRARGVFERLLDNYAAVALCVVTAVLCVTGVGAPVVSCAVALGLCVIGFRMSQCAADRAFLIALVAFQIFGMLSTYKAYGDLVSGYAPIQVIIPVVYVMASSLSAEGVRILRKACLGLFGVVAAAGIIVELCGPREGMHRLAGMFYNANATGIFLALGWFLLIGTKFDHTRSDRVLEASEPVVLAALAMTLSMGSFLSMAVGTVVMLLGIRKQGASWRDVFQKACETASRAVVGMSVGLLAYIAMARTDWRWLGWLVLGYVLALAFCWRDWLRYLGSNQKAAACLGIAGVLVAFAAVALRPSAAATFAERIEMVQNGLKYVFVDPLCGVGPFRWRMLNMADADKYFNTWHIHNVLVHVAVEFGLGAMAALVAAGVRAWKRCGNLYTRATLAAFMCHNMIDTSFFVVGIICVLMAVLGADAVEDDARVPQAAPWRPGWFLAMAGTLAAYFLLCMPMG